MKPPRLYCTGVRLNSAGRVVLECLPSHDDSAVPGEISLREAAEMVGRTFRVEHDESTRLGDEETK